MALVHYGETGVHRYGATGRPVVALHGIRGHGARWRWLAERHLPASSVLGIDLRGHGRSPGPPPWTIEQHVADVLAALDERGVHQADVLGHSFGGLIAVQLARTAPERVRRLVLLDPSVGIDPGRALGQARAALVPPSFADPAEAWAERRKAWPEVATEVIDAEIADHLVQAPDGRWGWRFEPAAMVTAFSEMTRPPVTPPPGVPTLLVRALHGGVVRPEYVAACRQALGDGLSVAELDCGHLVYLDRPDETGSLISNFLG